MLLAGVRELACLSEDQEGLISVITIEIRFRSFLTKVKYHVDRGRFSPH